jgi:hypothetical protein
VRDNPATDVKFASPVVSGRQSPQRYQGYSTPRDSPRETPSVYSPSSFQSPGKLNGAIMRQDVTEGRSIVAALIGNSSGSQPSLKANIFVDTGSDTNLIPSS